MKKKNACLSPIVYGLSPKKSLGQNFLRNPYYLRLVADAGDIKKGEAVLEIGPGDGALTGELLERGARILAIEKDRRLILFLKKKFAKEIAEKRLRVIEADALTFNPIAYRLSPHAYKVVANIPYYITGALLRKFLEETAQPERIVFLVQKEVAERIAREKKESILSLSVKAYGAPHYIKTVPRGAFAPVPAVDSAILAIENISRRNFSNLTHEKRFFELLRAGFAQKRKLLGRNLEKILGPQTTAALRAAGIPEKARAEDVGLAKWLILAK